jgi:sortase (surface protein transpeptidase)
LKTSNYLENVKNIDSISLEDLKKSYIELANAMEIVTKAFQSELNSQKQNQELADWCNDA